MTEDRLPTEHPGAETVALSERAKTACLLAHAQLREAQLMVKLAEAAVERVAFGIEVEYREHGAYDVISIHIENGVTRVPRTAAP